MAIDYSDAISENRLNSTSHKLLSIGHESPPLARVYVHLCTFSHRVLYGGAIALLLGACTVPLSRQTDLPPAVTPPKRNDFETILSAGERNFIARPSPQAFSICHGHTCAYITSLSLSNAQWQEVSDIFEPPALSPVQERERIREAIALLERRVGALSGTDADQGRNLAGLGKPGQMDCIDESTNTSVYLYMLQADGLLRWHRLEHRLSRGPFTLVLQPPHSTAVIRELGSGRRYAVDSWFLDNGAPPFIVPVEQWKRGWQP